MNILILQKNPTKAGAQNSLRRLLSSQAFRNQQLLVVTGTHGWFLEQVKAMGVPHIAIDYPSVRSLYGRLIGNKLWVAKVVRELKRVGFRPDILQANNHLEAPFLHLFKEHFPGAKTVAFIRDPDVSERDYKKYGCDQCDLRIAVSQFMHDALLWDTQAKVFNNGVFQSEIYPPPETKSAFPSRWLVVGNPSARKGWADLFAALGKLHAANRLGPVKQIVFTGVPSEAESAEYRDLCQKLKAEISLEFVPFFTNLGEACQSFDLIIQPSRSESFGMALLEACCTGRCVISSKTGIAENLIVNPNLLFEPGQVDGLAACLDYVLANWQVMKDDREETLQIVREKFSTENNTEKVIALYQQMLGEAPTQA